MEPIEEKMSDIKPEEMLSDEQRSLMQQESEQQSEVIDEAVEQTEEERLKIILDKVQDINQDGIAFTVITKFYGDPSNEHSQKRVKKEKPNFQKIQNILQEGLLGAQHHHGHFKNESLRHWQWKRTARSRNVQKNSIWFSITGRSTTEKSPFPIENGYMMEDGYGVAFLFSLDSFKELPPGSMTDWKRFSERHKEIIGGDIRPELRTFAQSYGDTSLEGIKSFYENGEKTEDKTNYTGFVTPFRINPGRLSGIAIGANIAPEVQQQIIDSMLEVDQEKPNLLLPVYNSHGDLLWPIHMSRDEVAEFLRQKQETTEAEEEANS